MFTQKNGFNTNKCNGCEKHCTISAFYYTRRGTGYLPVIDNKIKTYYIDTNNIKHQLHLYKNPHDAMNCAKSLTQMCHSFKDTRTFRQTTTLDYNVCVGCPKRCMITSQKIQGVFYPKIGTKIIQKYINSYGETRTPPIFYDDFRTKMYAMQKIVKLCDHYQHKKK